MLCVLSSALAAAPSAHASQASLHNSSEELRIEAGGGEANAITLSATGKVVAIHDAAGITGGDCAQVDAYEVRCTMDALGLIEVTLGDGNDALEVRGDLHVHAFGNGGNDTLQGDEAGEDLYGGGGDDTLIGGGGADLVSGDAGADALEVRDGVVETVTCGTEDDTVTADPEDVAGDDCEHVSRSLEPPPIDDTPPADGDPSKPRPDRPGGGSPGGDGPASGPLDVPGEGNAFGHDKERGADPVPGHSVALAAKDGTVRVKPPGESEYVELDPSRPLPVGSVIDATDGVVTLTAASNLSGGTQTADFTGAAFRIDQDRSTASMITELTLVGGNFAACPRARRRSTGRAVARAAARRRPVRKLWGSGHGRFRTRGRSSAATVRGTIWTVADRCDGT